MRCAVAVDTGSPGLPVLPTGAKVAIRKSKASKWRAGVLIGVHVLAAAHIAHYSFTGRTLSPVEPSESAYTIEHGYVTAGAIFFAVALLATLIFGRFFCGWGCHIVALQDLCGWIMKKLGVRPKPFRARFLAFLPLAVAFQMFAWPTVRRRLYGPPGGFEGFTSHLMTDHFWLSFPGPLIAVLTFVVCGFATVYFLGAKGFCTYGCPYGALFGPVDVLSAGRIVVSDACEQCGHCTATCTSNVRVHEEVKLYGMVVDPGCMKCLDCVSVCPKGALRVAFAKPSLFKRTPSVPRSRRYDLSLAEELLVAAVGALATVTFFRLYDGPPLLMSAGLGAVTAFVTLEQWHLVRRPNVRIQSLVLKSAGKVRRSGWAFAVLAFAWWTFTAHSAFVQWHRARGLYYLNRSEATRSDVLSGAALRNPYTPAHHHAVAQAFRHLALADRWGILDVRDIKLGLSWVDMLRGDFVAAVTDARRAVEIASDQSRLLLQNLIEILVAAQRVPEAIEALRTKLELGQPTADDHFRLAYLLELSGRLDEAASEYQECLSIAPDSAQAHYGLGELLRRRGDLDAARGHLLDATRIAPGHADAHAALGLTYLAQGARDDALRSLERAIELAPDDPETATARRQLIERLKAPSGP